MAVLAHPREGAQRNPNNSYPNHNQRTQHGWPERATNPTTRRGGEGYPPSHSMEATGATRNQRCGSPDNGKTCALWGAN